jgi:hydrogenase nickel incorporation protein HypA/HybF
VHELSIASAVHDTVIRHAEGRPVTAVQMRIGRLRQVVPGSLAFYFGIVGRGTPTEGAELEIEMVDARLSCACGTEWDPAPGPAESEDELVFAPQFRCPACGAAGAEVVSGEEMEVESIVVEEAATVGGDPAS